MTWLKAFFSIFGFASLFYILGEYGWANLLQDFTLINWHIIPLALTFIPTLFCYSIAWLLVTEIPDEREKITLTGKFFSFTVISIAWNNLSPFLKVLGEPVKVILLNKKLTPRAATKSVVIYNIVHLIGTVSAFLLTALFIPLFFSVTNEIKWGLFLFIIITLFILLILFFFPAFARRTLKKKIFLRIRSLSLWLRWSFHKIQLFYRNQKQALLFAIFLEISARFLEGITFYYAFFLLNEPISITSAAFLDVGRALIDNLFFFIPYQVGSREWGVTFLLHNILQVPAKSIITAALLYRLVEILWMFFGYMLWIKEGSSAKSVR